MKGLARRLDRAESVMKLEDARAWNRKRAGGKLTVTDVPDVVDGAPTDLIVSAPSGARVPLVIVPELADFLRTIAPGETLWAHGYRDAVDYSSGPPRSTIDNLHRVKDEATCRDCRAVRLVTSEKFKSFARQMARFGL